MADSTTIVASTTAVRTGAVLAPLALAQFICSFAGSNMNVMLNDISRDLDTSVQAVQAVITVFLLVMAALMIPGGKLTDRYGRKRCFLLGLMVYGIGAVLSAVSPGIGILLLGNSIFEGVGTALLIPPVYILTTLLFEDLRSRARAFGIISAAGGVGAAAGPLIGGLIASAISWRAAFGFQALIVAVIVLLSLRIKDPLPADPSRTFDVRGAVLSAAGLILIVLGILATDNSLSLMVLLMASGVLVLIGFFASSRSKERAGDEPLVSPSLFRNRVSNLGLLTQNAQWLMLMGVSFVVASYLQVVRGYNSVESGVIFTAATVGLLASSLTAGPMARRFAQRTLIVAGFMVTIIGILVLIGIVYISKTPWAFVPGLLIIGLGLGGMLTASVNVVQSSFPESEQGEISGVSRSISNLGSSLGAAIAGTILIAGAASAPGRAYATAMIVLAIVGVIGLAAALFLPHEISEPVAAEAT